MAIFPGEAGLASFIGATDDGSGGDNWSYKTCKTPVKSSPSTNQYSTFYRPDAFPVTKPSVSKNLWHATEINFRLTTTTRVTVKMSTGSHLYSFYHVTLCINAVFAVARCLSVLLVYCIQTAEDIVQFFSQLGSPIILVFWHGSPISNSHGTPSAGVQNTRGWENFQIFDWNCRLFRKRY